MTGIPLGVGAYRRTYGQEPEVELRNRFFEQTPTNQVEGLVLLARPGNTMLVSAGVGPITVISHQPGAFNDDLFFVSGEQLFRWDGVAVPLAIAGTVATGTTPSITFVTGAGFEHLFITDGVLLQFYDGEAAATGVLTVSGGNIVATDTFELDGVFYEWTAGSVDAGSPAGTMADPFLIAFSDDTTALENAVLALNATGIGGTDYSTALTAHLTVLGVTSTITTLSVRARTRGTGGNSITSTETAVNTSWGGATLSGGGAQTLNGIVTPDDITFVSLTTLNSFALCAQSNSARFYWIQPGATTIDALDFATAENEPDQLIEIQEIGDVVYMFGQSSTEVWYATLTTDPNESPFRPTKGLAFSQGVLEGTAVPIRTQAITIAEDGVIYQIVGGPQRISNNGIEERVRLWRNALGV